MRSQDSMMQLQNQFIPLHGIEWVERQRIIGQHLADIMGILQRLVAEKTQLTLLEIDALVEAEIRKRNCTPTFLHFKGFPASVCISLNQQLVHGIPSGTHLNEGDIVSFDFGITDDAGVIVDSAITLCYGEPTKEQAKFLADTQECLYNAIKAVAVGKRLGVIGNAIYKTATNAGYGVITKFGGHGIDLHTAHAQPFVSNRASPDEGIVIQEGLCIAIEPLLSIGSTDTLIEADGWTVKCLGTLSAHVEHTLYVHSDHIEVMTHRSDETLPRKVYFN